MTIDAPAFAIGDTAYIARAGHVQKWIECPDCCGKAALTVILGDDSRVSIACSCSDNPFHGVRGKVSTYDYSETVEAIVIDGVETVAGKAPRYRFNGTSCSWNTADAENLFATKEEASKRAADLVAEHEVEEIESLNRKMNANKNWAWHVTYHRRELARAKRDVEYHTAKLAVAQEKAK